MAGAGPRRPTRRGLPPDCRDPTAPRRRPLTHPIQGGRGASPPTLPRFTTAFPRPDGTPAPVLELRTSWRNPPRALHVANAGPADARRRSVAVLALRPRPDATP